MARKLKPLDVERETKPGKYSDNDGPYLNVASATSKNWFYRYWWEGKERWYGLGSLGLVIAHAEKHTARPSP